MKKWVLGFLFILAAGNAFAGPNDSNWIQLFRAGDTALSDWLVKIQGKNLGVNFHNSFRYAVSKDATHSPRLEIIDTTGYDEHSYGYGHLFYKTPFSDYLLRAQFHFPTNKTFAGQSWTIQNNGLMLHCQNPHTMGVGQGYPNSFEDQLLGYWSGAAIFGNGQGSTSSNVCLPGTQMEINGQAANDGNGRHCVNAKFHSLQYDSIVTQVNGANSSNATWGGENIWQYALARVVDSQSMTFWVRSRPDTAWDSVMHFTNMQYWGGQYGSSTPASSGYIALQMEGTSTEFAKIELLNLKGCMTPTDVNYKNYFVANDPTQCGLPSGIARLQRKAQGIFTLVGNRIVAESEIFSVQVFDLKGVRLADLHGARKSFLDLSGLKPGLYTFKVSTQKGFAQAAFTRM